MTLPELIRDVTRRAASDDPLDRLAAAGDYQREMTDELDELLDHFVREARDAGHSWTDIGDVLGVTKQAAQQRHRPGRRRRDRAGRGGGGRGRFARFTPTARRAVVDAQRVARLLGDRAIDTEHVLLGLLETPTTLAADVLSHWDVDREGIEVAILTRSESAAASPADSPAEPAGAESGGSDRRGRGRGERTRRRGHIPFTAGSKRVLEVALREAQALDHPYIDSEHILLGLLTVTDGLAAQLLTERGVTYAAVREAVATASTAD